ncbi:transporter substrate-binding domain-containing protein [Shewanella sp. NIFS-20-20]|uniref:transporter substrate-binding domain-containing protein n=1 Tax=Shewanella sp. NIFS-20-20 TaxID=2853806 RepID=UPI001C46D839|nr:transporter substrate-binding domain-containing protein [Shewanella sp. NIFS-20-20]MBV7315710.1 transporter substrate-binding domain-containing protein [Shewanella sp. NIFS-20-20]
MRFTSLILIFYTSLTAMVVDHSYADPVTPNSVAVEVPEHLLDEQHEFSGYPYQFKDINGNNVGALPHLWQTFIGHHPQLEMEGMPVILGIPMTPYHQQRRQLSSAMLSLPVYLYRHHSLANKPLSSIADEQIAAVKGSWGEWLIGQAYPDLSLRIYENNHALYQAIIASEVSAFVANESLLYQWPARLDVLMNYPKHTRSYLGDGAFAAGLARNANISQRQGFETFSSWLATPKGLALLDHHSPAPWPNSTLTIASQTDVAPFVSFGDNGQLQGFYIDIWRQFAQRNNQDIQFVAGTMAESIEAVVNQQAQVHIAMPKGRHTARELMPAVLLYQVNSTLFMSPGRDSADLHTVGVFASAPYLEQLQQQLPQVVLKPYHSLSSLLAAVESNDIQGFVGAKPWIEQQLLLQDKWGLVEAHDAIHFGSDIYVMVQPEDYALQHQLIEQFAELSAASVMDIEKRWLINHDEHWLTNQHQSIQLSAAERAIVKRHPNITMGYIPNWFPFEYTDANGEFSGINRGVADHLSSGLGIGIEFKQYPHWQALETALLQGEVDMVASIIEDDKREQTVVFTQGYWPNPWAMLSREQAGLFPRLDQLPQYKVAMVEVYQIIHSIMRLAPQLLPVLVKSTAEGVAAVEQGKVDIFFGKAAAIKVYADDDWAELKLLSGLPQSFSQIGLHHAIAPLLPMFDKALYGLGLNEKKAILAAQPLKSADKALLSSWQGWAAKLGWVVAALLTILLLIMKGRRRRHGLDGTDVKTQELPCLEMDEANRARQLWDNRLAYTIDCYRRYGGNFAVVMIDIPEFHLLSLEQQRVFIDASQRCVRASDPIDPWQTNSFVALIQQVDDRQQLCLLIEELHQRLSSLLASAKPNVAVVMGAAMYPTDAQDGISLMRSADLMCAQAMAAKQPYFLHLGGREQRK